MTDPLILVDPDAATFELTDLRAAQLPVTDLSAHRGDGIFETVLVNRGAHGAMVVSRERHFTRFRASASALDLPEPDQGLWDRVIDSLIAEVAAADPENVEFGIRYALSRGEQGADGQFRPRGWAFPVPVDDHIHTARKQGVTAVSLDRGFDAYLGSKAPWLLIGAKTLSYAVNQPPAVTPRRTMPTRPYSSPTTESCSKDRPRISSSAEATASSRRIRRQVCCRVRRSA